MYIPPGMSVEDYNAAMHNPEANAARSGYERLTKAISQTRGEANELLTSGRVASRRLARATGKLASELPLRRPNYALEAIPHLQGSAGNISAATRDLERLGGEFGARKTDWGKSMAEEIWMRSRAEAPYQSPLNAVLGEEKLARTPAQAREGLRTQRDLAKMSVRLRKRGQTEIENKSTSSGLGKRATQRRVAGETRVEVPRDKYDARILDAKKRVRSARLGLIGEYGKSAARGIGRAGLAVGETVGREAWRTVDAALQGRAVGVVGLGVNAVRGVDRAIGGVLGHRMGPGVVGLGLTALAGLGIYSAATGGPPSPRNLEGTIQHMDTPDQMAGGMSLTPHQMLTKRQLEQARYSGLANSTTGVVGGLHNSRHGRG